jgi:multiple sugar transport system substrate-binding protein
MTSPNPAKHEPSHTLTWLTIEPHGASSAALAEWFEQETGVHVAVDRAPYSEITDRATHDVTSGRGRYDVIQYWYPMLGTLAEKEILADISSWWSENIPVLDPADFISVFRDTWCLIGDRRYGVPFDGDMHLLFYNRDILERHSLRPPATWDEYRHVARTVTEREGGDGVYGCGIMAADIPLILIGTYLNRLAGFGGHLFDTRGEPVANSPVAVAALEHLLSELPHALPEPARVAFDEMLGPWLAGQVAMVEFWADLGKISDSAGATAVAGRWGVVPLPRGPAPGGRTAAPLNAGWSLGISTRSQQPSLARDFLAFALRPDIGLRVSTMDGGLDPCRWSIYGLPAYRECVTEELAAAAESAVKSAAVPWPTDARWPTLQRALHMNLYLAVTGTKTAQQALDETQTAWRQVLPEQPTESVL